MSAATVTVCSFYRFVALDNVADLQLRLLNAAAERHLLGTVLLAAEGINGSLSGSESDIRSWFDWVGRSVPALANLDGHWNEASAAPFSKMRVRLRAEIVTLGRPDINPANGTGQHVDARTWNQLLDRDDVVIIDTRNDYEIDVGTFPGIENPDTKSFRDFPAYVAANRERLRTQPVAMFCTGGIRCEKAAALLIEEGCSEVYQLEGGILGYLASVSDDDNRWQGECFVFDTRVAVDQSLAPGGHVQCHACRRPLGPSELASEQYEEGLSCPHCYGTLSEERLDQLRERRRQNRLRRERAAKQEAKSA
ncbi:MAG: rhodanese-related sulfurtransferase [Pseudomonadota bacterium]